METETRPPVHGRPVLTETFVLTRYDVLSVITAEVEGERRYRMSDDGPEVRRLKRTNFGPMSGVRFSELLRWWKEAICRRQV